MHNEVEAPNRMHVHELRPRKDHRGFELISDALPFRRVGYGSVSDAVHCAKLYSRSHHAVMRACAMRPATDRDARARGRVQRVLAVTVESSSETKSRYDATADERFSPAVDQIPELIEDAGITSA